MAQAAVGEGPVVFFTSEGRQVTYHLSAITFVGGVPQATPRDPNDAVALQAWLNALVKQGRLASAPLPPAAQAMRLTAAKPGIGGNSITVDVRPTSSATTVDVTVTWIDVYADLTLATLEARLGSATTPATVAGLVQLKTLPTAGPDPVASSPAEPTVASPASWDLPSATQGTAAFTVEPRSGVDAELVTVGVSDVRGDAGDKTFTLTATWQVEVEDVTQATVETVLKPAVAFAVVVDPPQGGGPYKLPMLGTVTLSGGAERALARPASATIMAN